MAKPERRKLAKIVGWRNYFVMRDPRTALPPMNSLVVFEVAARHLSFTLAAEELTISREAVSRHIRRLEKVNALEASQS